MFVRDLRAGTTRRISVSNTGIQGNGYSYGPAFSADGHYFAFTSYASNLVRDDANSNLDAFVLATW